MFSLETPISTGGYWLILAACVIFLSLTKCLSQDPPRALWPLRPTRSLLSALWPLSCDDTNNPQFIIIFFSLSKLMIIWLLTYVCRWDLLFIFLNCHLSVSTSKLFSVAETDSQPDEEKKWIEKKIDSIAMNSNSYVKHWRKPKVCLWIPWMFF